MNAKTNIQGLLRTNLSHAEMALEIAKEILRNDLSHAEMALEIAKGTIALQNWVVTSDRPGCHNFVVVSGGWFFYGHCDGPVPTFTLEDANLLATGVFRDGEGVVFPLKVVTAAAFHAKIVEYLKDTLAALDSIPE